MTMTLIEKATIMHYHRHRIATYGPWTHEALGWRAEASQRKRFEVLASVGDLTGCSVLDVGCGYGDLKGYLDQRVSAYTYIGIDQMPDFIAEAKARYQTSPNTSFCQADFTTVAFPRVDYVMASGALGYRCDTPGFYDAMIGKMYEAASRALVFNMLDATWFPVHPLLTGHDCEAVVKFCRTLSPCVEVVRGYLADDFTVMVFRGLRRPRA
ncbi:class I SAM-dependent methyltransferase [Candidatus Entotheonella palauensis]|uniref:class I SAM-dependent methyltransferase n=1 Tax=Candidatus Entotheonella palauensis TaxID=93172 RepID=UPI0015C4B20A|nr:class I SAM-dependent methyltransferase [Candidatus Entotheonella palauensis]